MTLFSAPSTTDTQVVNLARLLLTLDTDGNPDNGIAISDAAYSAATATIDFTSPSFDTDVAGLVASGGGNIVLISADNAIAHLSQLILIGSWYLGSNQGSADKVMTFLDNTHYIFADHSGDPACGDGMELGTYSWNQSTGIITVNDSVNTDGECGLSNPVPAGIKMSLNGNTLTFLGAGSATLNKVLLSSTEPIIGSWYSNQGNANMVMTFLDNTHYIFADHSGDPACGDGMELGTYSWNQSTGIITVNDSVNTDGECGLSNPVPAGIKMSFER